jgi:hypothetical protein
MTQILSQSYTVAGLFEELVKYWTIRLVLNKPHVTDPRALIAYGACAGTVWTQVLCWALRPWGHCPGAVTSSLVSVPGAAFEVVENLLLYNFEYRLETSMERSLMPLHTLTAVMMAIWMGHKRFLGGTERWYTTIIPAVLVHGASGPLPCPLERYIPA